MKQPLFSVLIFLLTIQLSAQHSEFITYPNGLIYSESTMEQLTFIVDSLNLKFNTCSPERVYYSEWQTLGYVIYFKNGNSAAKKDMQAQMPIEKFLEKCFLF